MAEPIDFEEEQVLGVPRGRATSATVHTVPRSMTGEAPDQADSLGLPRRNERDESAEPIGPNGRNLFLESSSDTWPQTDDVTDTKSQSLRNADRIFVCFVVIVFGLTLLFLASQALSLWGLIQSLPLVGRWFAYFGLTVITAAILSAMGYLIWQFLRLRETPSVSLAALNQLHERSATRISALQQSLKAAQRLEEFIKEFSLAATDAPRLKKLGFEAEIEILQQHRSRLLDGARGGPQLFISDVDDHFLSQIDAVAKRRIHQYSKQVGWKTAAAPTGFLDASIVLVHSYLLIGDLCRIYNVRTTPGSTLVIMGLSLVNMIAASSMEDVSEHAANVAFKSLEGAPIIGGMIKGATRRAAEGAANALLLRRLGYATLKQLRPIQVA